MPVVYLIRHGQASFGAEDYDVLSAVGHRQAELVAAALGRRGVVQPDRIVAGSLNRQRDTAETCRSAAHFETSIETDPRWDEYDHVALLRQQEPDPALEPALASSGSGSIQPSLDAALLGWVRSGSPSSDGRTFEHWRDDAVAGQREFLDSLGRGGVGLAFSSGGVVAAICAEILGLGAEGFVALNRVTVNTGITKIVSGRGGTSLLSFNDHGHLEGAADLLTYR